LGAESCASKMTLATHVVTLLLIFQICGGEGGGETWDDFGHTHGDVVVDLRHGDHDAHPQPLQNAGQAPVGAQNRPEWQQQPAPQAEALLARGHSMFVSRLWMDVAPAQECRPDLRSRLGSFTPPSDSAHSNSSPQANQKSQVQMPRGGEGAGRAEYQSEEVFKWPAV
jgi:hypothetical protein